VDGWDPNKYACLGFDTDIKACTNCDQLNVTDISLCVNKLYLDCLKKGLIKSKGYCFVTYPVKLTPPTKWPEDTGQWTARKMCYLGVPSVTAVSTCRKNAGCPAPKKKQLTKPSPNGKRASRAEDGSIIY